MLNDNRPLLCSGRIQLRLQLNVQFGFLFSPLCVACKVVDTALCCRKQKHKKKNQVMTQTKLASNQTHVKRSDCCRNGPDALCARCKLLSRTQSRSSNWRLADIITARQPVCQPARPVARVLPNFSAAGQRH